MAKMFRLFRCVVLTLMALNSRVDVHSLSGPNLNQIVLTLNARVLEVAFESVMMVCATKEMARVWPRDRVDHLFGAAEMAIDDIVWP